MIKAGRFAGALFYAKPTHCGSYCDCCYRAFSHGAQRSGTLADQKPHQGRLALPGGKLNADDTSLAQAIIREVREETGLTIPAKHLRQVGTYGDADRDPRGCSVSVLYTLTEMVPESFQARAGDDASAVVWLTPIAEGPALAFDHHKMIDDAIQYLHDWRRLAFPGTQRLSEPRQCEIGSEFGERCPLPAQWEVNGWVMCDEDIQMLAAMNSDNEALVRPALVAIHPQKAR